MWKQIYKVHFIVFNLNFLSDFLGTTTTLHHVAFDQGNESSVSSSSVFPFIGICQPELAVASVEVERFCVAAEGGGSFDD